MVSDPDKIGESDLAHRFFAGRYAEVLAATFDRGAPVADRDVAFVVGALTFVDRVDEARGLFHGWRSRAGEAAPARTIAASRFFLGLAAARAGYFDRSFPLLVTEAFGARHDPDPWVRAFAFQGLACQCFFTGRYPGAAEHALRALTAAHEAGFTYVSMLATDMRGHSLAQMGQLQRGTALLEEANRQARRLGLVNNAAAVDVAIAIYAARFVPTAEALARLDELLRRRGHDSYTMRGLRAEVAVQRAFRGERTRALEALAEADRDALRGDTRRGKVVSLLARLWVTRWQVGPAACADLVEQARPLVEPRDVAFRAELCGFEIGVARARGDLDGEVRALTELRELWRRSRHFHARAALRQYEAQVPASAFDEDMVTPMLRAVATRDQTALSRAITLGWLGVIPELLGLAPGRRIILIPSEDLLLLEDHGDVEVRHRPPRWCPGLLRILASGQASKARIVEGLWGLRAYHPEIHDPPVRTTIYRLRSFLRPHPDWIEVGEDGYRTAVPVHLVSLGEAPVADPTPLWEAGEVPSLTPPRPSPSAPAAPAARDPEQLVFQQLVELEEASVPQLARAVELSASTVLRALRGLVADRRVERLGFARATRYRPRASA